MNVVQSVLATLRVINKASLMPTHAGRAVLSLTGSISRVVLTAAVAWQAIMILISVTSGSTVIVVIQIAVGIVTALSFAFRSLWVVFPVAMIIAGAGSYVASGDISSVLSFAACWQINFASCFAGLVLFQRFVIWLVMLPAIATSATIVTQLPHWGLQLPVSIIVTQASIIVAVRLGMAALLQRASDVDRAIADADDASLREQSLGLQSARLAEESRVLHDTAINTFAAIVAGGASVSDPARVRDQCARDMELIDQLRGDRAASAVPTLFDAFTQPGLPGRRSGVGDDELAGLDRRLPPRVTAAIIGCVREAVNNATKHSGAPDVEISITVEADILAVRISDQGIGFAQATPDRGLERSIMQRARDNGITATVTSAPDQGTTVTLRVAIDAPQWATGPDAEAMSDIATEVHRNSGAYWGIGVTVISIVLTIGGGTNEGLALFPMIGLMVTAVLLTRIPAFTASTVFLPLTLVVLTVAVFYLSARATAFGLVGATHWQALAATGPYVMLLSVTRRLVFRAGAIVAWVACVVVIVAVMLPTSVVASGIVLVAGCVGLGFSGVWAMFQSLVNRLVLLAAQARSDEYAARLRSEEELASQASYRRWTDAGLDGAAGLLRDLRDGRLDPDDEGTRAACDEEERYLRQLVQISPELVHLGSAFMPLLRSARDRGVTFTLRLGDSDAPSVRSAAAIADIVDANIRSVGSGDALSATLFPIDDGLTLTLTGPRLLVPEHAAHARIVQLGTTALLEAAFSAEDEHESRISPHGKDH